MFSGSNKYRFFDVNYKKKFDVNNVLMTLTGQIPFKF